MSPLKLLAPAALSALLLGGCFVLSEDSDSPNPVATQSSAALSSTTNPSSGVNPSSPSTSSPGGTSSIAVSSGGTSAPRSSSSILPPPTPPNPGTACECASTVEPVCASNGRTYINSCMATCADQPAVTPGACLQSQVTDIPIDWDQLTTEIDPILEVLTPTEMWVVQEALNDVVIPAELLTLPPEEMQEAVANEVLTQLMADPEVLAIAMRVLLTQGISFPETAP